MKKRFPWFLGGLALFLLHRCVFAPAPFSSHRAAAPVDPQATPEQRNLLFAPARHLSKGGFDWSVTPRAHYRVQGVVLSRHNYEGDWNSLFAPCDLAIAWGELWKDRRYRQLSWSQAGRWYYWRYGADFGHDNGFVARYSANNHILPANQNLERAAQSLRPGDLVELEGELVDLDGHRGKERRFWHTSLSREDTGDGSCELLYLRRLKIGRRCYE